MQQNPYQASIDQLKQQLAETEALLADPDMAQLAKDEINRLQQQIGELEQAAAALDLATQNENAEFSAEAPRGNCTIELRGGAGGDEAKNWASEILRMYLRFAETHRLKTEFIDDLVVKFIGSATLGGRPLSAYEIFQFESGVHRVQRVPTTEAAGRIHTSTASVAVLPEIPAHVITIREEDLEWQFMRAGGAGGQNVNKTNSAVRLTHRPSGIVVTSRQEKQQQQNRQIALQLLRAQLWEIMEEERLKKLGNARLLIGRAQRAEKIRTYNFPQNRITDHRTKQSWYSLDTMIEGDLEGMLISLREALTNPTETSSPHQDEEDQNADVD